jgi:hypothetical protein
MKSGVLDLITKIQAEEKIAFHEACNFLIDEIRIQNFIHNYLPNIPDWLTQYGCFFTNPDDHLVHSIRYLLLEGKTLTFEIEEFKLYIHVFVLNDKLEDIFLHVYQAECALEKTSDKEAMIEYRPKALIGFFYSVKNFNQGCFKYTYAYPYVFEYPKPKFKDLELNQITKEWIEDIKTLLSY